ncbi:MAG: hypothetical protein ACREQL_08805 [Candidatus Binatia bacterium]
MRVAILLNRDRPRLRTRGKQILTAGYELARGRGAAGTVLPEFDSFAALLDDDPLVLGTEAAIDWAALSRCDLLLWEWGWTDVPAARVVEIRRRCDVPTVLFPGPLDRFWRELDPRHVPMHLKALAATDAIGVMLRDTAGVYAALAPGAHVFHMPVPVDTVRFGAMAVPAAAREDVVLLTAPTRFCGGASQLPIATYLAFRRLAAEQPRLEGLAFCYDDEEERQARAMLRDLGLAGRVQVRAYVRPLGRFLDTIKACRLALSLPHAVIQGRTALMAACLRIPMVTSEEIETHRTLFPYTMVRWHDVDGAVAACRRLLDDATFGAAVCDRASAAVAYYAVPRARERLTHAFEAIAERRRVPEGA